MIWFALVLMSIGAGWLFGHGDVARNLREASEAGATTSLIALLGITTGLYGRERVRLRRTYASPTLAYGGKAALFIALSSSAAAVLSPVTWPSSMLPLFAAGGAAGASVWLANLPSRL